MACAVETNVLATGDPNEVRMIILGKTGTGKSAFGNTILGEKRFEEDLSPDSVTTCCASAIREFDGKQLFVVDTPGFFDTNMPENELHEEIAKSYQMTARPGPHAFLLILDPTARHTSQEYEAVKRFSRIFSPEAVNHTIIIFTHSDSLSRDGKTIEQYLKKLKREHPITQLIDQVGQRYLAVNNYGTTGENNSVVNALLDMIERMLKNNNGQVYKNPPFEDLAKVITAEMSRGSYKPFKPDGSYDLLPQTKVIVIDGYLCRRSDRRPN